MYLVFSANKSGEYFGYARMSSPINEDPTAVIGLAPKAQPAESIGPPPIAIPTDATEFCPRGIIIDDSARGTIFWDAERENTEGMVDVESDPSSRIGSGQDGDGLTESLRKAFQTGVVVNDQIAILANKGPAKSLELEPRSQDCKRWHRVGAICGA